MTQLMIINRYIGKTLLLFSLSFLLLACDMTPEDKDLLSYQFDVSEWNGEQTPRTPSAPEKPLVIGYFPSWKLNWLPANGVTALSSMPEHITHVVFAFAKPNLRYTKNSYDLRGTGIQTASNAGKRLALVIELLRARGIKILLSIGGPTYWGNREIYTQVRYNEIKDLVDDYGFDGVEWNFVSPIESSESNQAQSDLINFIRGSRRVMLKSDNYLVMISAPGAGISRSDLFSTSSGSGSMLNVFPSIGSSLDLVVYQANNIAEYAKLYDVWTEYAREYGFIVAHSIYMRVPSANKGYTPIMVAEMAERIREKRNNNVDGMATWHLSLFSAQHTAHNGASYLKIASDILNDSKLSASNYFREGMKISYGEPVDLGYGLVSAFAPDNHDPDQSGTSMVASIYVPLNKDLRPYDEAAFYREPGFFVAYKGKVYQNTRSVQEQTPSNEQEGPWIPIENSQFADSPILYEQLREAKI